LRKWLASSSKSAKGNGNPREPVGGIQAHADFSGNLLEVEADFSCQRSRRYVVRAAERGQEIVKRFFVRQIDDRKTETPFARVAVEKIVIADRCVKQISRSDAWRILVVILRSGRRYFDQGRAELRREAGERQSDSRRRVLRSAE
jgi:hypothetical protein